MKKLKFHANTEKPQAQVVVKELKRIAEKAGLEITDGDADIIIALGGDGTILRTVHEFEGIPILGFNLGGLGYLAAVSESEFAEAIDKLAKGCYKISERRLLEVNGKYPALNDVVVVREMSGHSLRLDLEVDGRIATKYMADGLIFATPTGSTAYSLAAGGPVLMPDTTSFVVTPMNPHALGVRPLVVTDDAQFKVTARARTAGNAIKCAIYADGEHVLTLDEGEEVKVAKALKTAKLVELEGYDPYVVLVRKLGWSGSNVK